VQQHFRPATERELGRVLAEASAAGTPLAILGQGTKSAIGRNVQAAVTVTTASMRGISLYEPTELVMSALVGTPLARIEAELAAKGQMLPFEPVELGPVLGGPTGESTIGGVFATNISGARRISSGSARDHFIGVKALTGTGTPFKSGGRVMNNVTGYDLARGLAGSWGTLAVMTEVTFKVVPVPEEVTTLLIFGLTGEIAVEALCAGMGSPFEVSGAIHIEAELAKRLRHAPTRAMATSVTALRLENFSASVAYRRNRLAELLKPYGEAQILDHANAQSFWDELRQLSVLQGSKAPLWRISTSPKNGPKVVAAIRRYMEARAFYDWSGGLVWLEVLPASDAGATDIRRVMATYGGHATLIRADPPVRAAVDVFHPLEPALAEVTRRIKGVFDPSGILNPGRMYADM
jgi:glycolate oxidase FAD binding subunit